ncbi:hypothetical protein ACG33_05940 [Steroidobacter denitrificans]|uniref:YhdP central domain-containing protein n=1 Tax=Steroidobacter denitrificans TaxID=465721 RepID=A0A127F8A0_STEDE|nr:YhdP family protein [Steroidobacter denitrificans]AMN46644.1 hypothetical protein ACG33_05940 [Steroidobacter denitrificans]
MASRAGKRLKRLLGCLAAVLVLAGLLLGAFGFVVGRVPEYRGQLQDWLNERSGLVIEFRTISARLRLYGPELVFNDAVVRTPDHTRVLAAASRGSVGFDVWNALRTGRLAAGRFTLEGPRIGLVRTHSGRIELLGQSALPERGGSGAFALDQLPTGRFQVRHAVVSFQDEITGRGPWSLSGVNFILTRDSGSMQLQGAASLPHSLGDGLTFSAHIAGALEDYGALAATFALEGRNIDLAGWAELMPDAWPTLEAGHGSVKLSGQTRGAALTQLSAEVAFVSVSASMPQWTIPLPSAEPMHQPVRLSMPQPSGLAASDLGPADARPMDPGRPEPPTGVTDPQPADADAGDSIPPLLSYTQLGFTLELQREADAWSLSLRDIDLSTAASPWRARHIQTRWSQGPEGEFSFAGRADHLILQNLWPLLAVLPERASLAWLRALNMRGDVQDLEVAYSKAQAQAPPHYTLSARLQGVGFAPLGRAPGLAGLSGELQATEQGGQATLAAQDLRFDLPRLFREPLEVQSLTGALLWRRNDAGWILTGEELHAQSPDGRAQGRIELALPENGASPLLHMDLQLQDLQVSATSRYVPAGKLTAGTMEWFDHAFVAGRLSSGQVTFQGPVRSFPFRDGAGSFLARGHVENAIFNYQPGWTPARDISAEVEFRNESLEVRASSANIDELQLSETRAHVADLQELHIVIQTAVQGRLQQGLRFLQRSPVAANLGADFARLSGKGPIRSSVYLDLPVKSFQNRILEVTTRLTDAQVSMQGVAAPASAVTGFLTLRNSQLAAADLRGRWLGGDFEVQAHVGEGQDPDTSVLTGRGHAAAAHLRTLLELPAAVGIEGAADWQATATFRPASAAAPRSWSVNVQSDLAGLAIALPEPLGKRAEQHRPLQFGVQLVADDAVLARGALGEVRSLIRLTRAKANRGTQDGWRLDRGGVRADGIPPALPAHRGLRLEGSLRRLVLDEWLALSSGAGSAPLTDFLQAANLRIDEFGLFGYAWHDVRGLLQATSAGWRVDVTGPDGAGQVLIPARFSGTQPLRANLERLVLRKAEAEAEAEDAGAADRNGDPQALPNLQLHVSDLRWGDRTIGALDLKASRVPQGIRFDSISVRSEAARAEGHGAWLSTGEGQHSSLTMTITSTDVEATLSALGYDPFIEARHGRVGASVSWPGGFGGNILARASGTISVNAEAGQLMNLQPGAGRVLGLFSIAALPRRLALDFSDLTDKGLAFDNVHGDFQLQDGNAYTSNLLLSGPAVEIGIAGRTGLGTRDYDQTAVVTGNLGASLPMAGVLAGGPAIGAALLLFSQVFKEPLKGITRGYYRITGPWEEPVVERVDAAAAGKADIVGKEGRPSLHRPGVETDSRSR